MRLVDDWKRCHKWWSVRMLALSGTLQLAYAGLPQRVHDDLPQWVTQNFTTAILVLTVVAGVSRVVQQKDGDNGPDKSVQS